MKLHKNYQGFDTNITIGGYKKPFTTGSKGGVALYTKDNINAFEREDLKTLMTVLKQYGLKLIMKNPKTLIVVVYIGTPIVIFRLVITI